MTPTHSATRFETDTTDHSATPLRHRLAPATQTKFQDPFLASWINGQLGAAEYRPLLLLRVFCPDEHFDNRDRIDAFATSTITEHGGRIIWRHGHQVIGVWGCDGIATTHPFDAIAAALALAARPGARCLLHVADLAVPRDETVDISDGVVFALSGLPNDIHDLTGAAEAVLLCESMLDFCGFDHNMLAVTAPGRGGTTAALFALPLGAADAAIGRGELGPESAAAVATRLDALGDLRPLLCACAVTANDRSEFPILLLARVLEIEPDRLRPAIDAACDAGLIIASDGPGQYAIGDAALRAQAYQMVPAADRLRLHRKAASALRALQPDIDPVRVPAAIARHHYHARETRQSRRWFSKAAWQAIVTGGTQEAVAHLRQALAQNETRPTAFDRALLQLLGVQLALTRGNGSNAVFDAYLQSVSIAGEASRLVWGQEFRSLWLAQTCHIVKGEVRAALTIGNLLLRQLAERTSNKESALGRPILIHRVQGLTQMLAGRLDVALTHYDYVAANYRPDRHAVLRFAYGSDQLALAHAHLAWLHTIAGRPEAADQAARSARLTSEELDHPHTTAHVMSVLALAWLAAGRHCEAVLAAQEARATAVEHCFAYWVSWSDVILAADQARRAPRSGYQELTTAMSAYQATDALQLCPMIFAHLSAAASADGRADLSLKDADAGLVMTHQSGCLLYRPELLRQRARALFALDRLDEANGALEAGYRDACRSGARLYARSIARDGIRLCRGQQQIAWQSRYHADYG